MKMKLELKVRMVLSMEVRSGSLEEQGAKLRVRALWERSSKARVVRELRR